MAWLSDGFYILNRYAIGKDAAAMKAVVGEEALSPEEKVGLFFYFFFCLFPSLLFNTGGCWWGVCEGNES
jgi:hypothetical protein